MSLQQEVAAERARRMRAAGASLHAISETLGLSVDDAAASCRAAKPQATRIDTALVGALAGTPATRGPIVSRRPGSNHLSAASDTISRAALIDALGGK